MPSRHRMTAVCLVLLVALTTLACSLVTPRRGMQPALTPVFVTHVAAATELLPPTPLPSDTPVPFVLEATPTEVPTATARALATQPRSGSPVKIVFKRLKVTYEGLDGEKVIGSGCPGVDGQGQIENIHFTVRGVDPNKKVVRVVVAGDNSTLTWESPCYQDWALKYKQDPNYPNRYDVYIAPSEDTEIYTLLFFYDDNSVAMGMTLAN